MASPRLVTSKVTDRNQTTLPPSVRSVLGIERGERLGYVIEGTRVRLVNATALEREDPVLDRFLDFLAGGLASHPHTVTPFPPALLHRARELTQGVAIDHDAPIEGATAL